LKCPIILQVIVFPRITSYLGYRWTFRLGTLVFAAACMVLPFSNQITGSVPMPASTKCYKWVREWVWKWLAEHRLLWKYFGHIFKWTFSATDPSIYLDICNWNRLTNSCVKVCYCFSDCTCTHV